MKLEPYSMDEFTAKQAIRRGADQARRGRLPKRVALIVAAAMLLSAGALAARFMFSALNERQALPGAKEAVVDIGMEAFESNLIRYQPIDALIDGGRLIVTAEAQAIDPAKYMIVDSWGGRDDADEIGDMTWPEYAESLGKALVEVEMGMRVNGITPDGFISEVFEGDTLRITFNTDIPFMSDDPDAKLDIELSGNDQQLSVLPGMEGTESLTKLENDGDLNRMSKHFTIKPKRIESEKLRFEGPFMRKYMSVDFVEFERSAVSLVMRVQYTLPDILPGKILDAMPEVCFVMSGKEAQQEDSRLIGALDRGYHPTNEDKYANYSFKASPSGNYLEQTVWAAIEKWPETFELNILYKGMDEWDAPLILKALDGIPTRP